MGITPSSPPQKKPPFILEEELVHYYYNSIQFLSKLFKTISSHKNSRYYPLDADITILFVASKGKKNPNIMTKIVKIEEVKIHIFWET